MVADTPKKHLELVKQKGVERNDKKANSPGILKAVEDNALASFKQLTEHLFSATDDLFYELSKRASSNNEQNLYFESMREIRVKKEGLISTFLQALASGFENFVNNVAPTTLPQETDVALSIVDGDDLEIELAQKSMSSRARGSYKSELYELRHLSKGKLAPEIRGQDQDGRPFRLSDYRGKVVLLYFWTEH